MAAFLFARTTRPVAWTKLIHLANDESLRRVVTVWRIRANPFLLAALARQGN